MASCARIGRFLPLAPRIALRETSRNRAAAAPAISAVMGCRRRQSRGRGGAQLAGAAGQGRLPELEPARGGRPRRQRRQAGRPASGLAAVRSVALATTRRMPTVAEQDRFQGTLGTDYEVYVERGPGSQPATSALLVLAIVAGLITLGAAAIATGLAAADGRADLGTLATVGASPRVRRGLSLSQSGVIAGLGSLLGTAGGWAARSPCWSRSTAATPTSGRHPRPTRSPCRGSTSASRCWSCPWSRCSARACSPAPGCRSSDGSSRRHYNQPRRRAKAARRRAKARG